MFTSELTYILSVLSVAGGGTEPDLAGIGPVGLGNREKRETVKNTDIH